MFRPYMAIIRFFFLFLLRFRYINRMGDLHIAIYIAEPEGKNPDDGHIRPKHVVLLLILEYTSFI